MPETDTRTEIERSCEAVSTLFPGAVLLDDTPLWLAWEMAKDAWLAELPTANTRLAYAADLRLFLDWAGVDPWQVSSALAVRYKAHLIDRELAPATVNRRLSALSSFFTFVRRTYVFRRPDRDGTGGTDVSLWDADRANPFDAVRRLHVTPYGKAVYPTTDELVAIFGAIDRRTLLGQRDFALLYAYAVSCRRASELLALRWGDVQPAAGDDDAIISYRCKGGDLRRARVDRLVYHAILDYLRADGRPPEALQPGDYVFQPVYPGRAARLGHTSDGPRPLCRGTASKVLQKYARRAGVPREKAHLHGLRHAGARLRVEQMKARGTVDYLVLMNLLGHRSMATTQIYVDRTLADPEDPGGAAAAAALLPRSRKRRRPAPPVQDTLFDPEEPS